jgi:hypothetical protein
LILKWSRSVLRCYARAKQDMSFTKSELRSAGFVGWLTFAQVRPKHDLIPLTNGVYVVTDIAKKSPAFLRESCGGWFNSKNPSVSSEQLAANWVDGAEVVYIGKADQLRRRVRDFADFGAGKPIGHWGGRLIWQLPAVSDLLVAWKATPGRVSREVEAELIRSFRSAYGKPPFANNPHRWGR